MIIFVRVLQAISYSGMSKIRGHARSAADLDRNIVIWHNTISPNIMGKDPKGSRYCIFPWYLVEKIRVFSTRTPHWSIFVSTTLWRSLKRPRCGMKWCAWFWTFLIWRTSRESPGEKLLTSNLDTRWHFTIFSQSNYV